MTDSHRDQPNPVWQPPAPPAGSPFIDHVPSGFVDGSGTADTELVDDRFVLPESSRPGYPSQLSSPTQVPPHGLPSSFPGWGPPPPIEHQPPAPAPFPLAAGSPTPPASYPSAPPAPYTSPAQPPAAFPTAQQAPYGLPPQSPASFQSAPQPPSPYASPAQPPVAFPPPPVAQHDMVPASPPPMPYPGAYTAPQIPDDEPYDATMLHAPVPQAGPAVQAPARAVPTDPAPKRRGVLLPVVGALVAGLLLGGGGVFGASAAGLLGAGTPKPIAVSVDKLPTTFLGLTRSDLDGSPDAAQVRAVAEATIASFEKSYGAPGVQMGYGDKGALANVWVQNGSMVAPVANVDTSMIRAQTVSGWLEVPGSATTTCRVSLYPAVKLPANPTAADVAAGKAQVIGGKGDAFVVCVRRDVARNVSVQASVQKWGDSNTRGEIAQKLAAALDEAFPALTK